MDFMMYSIFVKFETKRKVKGLRFLDVDLHLSVNYNANGFARIHKPNECRGANLFEQMQVFFAYYQKSRGIKIIPCSSRSYEGECCPFCITQTNLGILNYDYNIDECCFVHTDYSPLPQKKVCSLAIQKSTLKHLSLIIYRYHNCICPFPFS
jgi:hypothetical protein